MYQQIDKYVFIIDLNEAYILLVYIQFFFPTGKEGKKQIH
jgi:hypothetical protein